MTSRRTPSGEHGTGPYRRPDSRAAGTGSPPRPRHAVPHASVFVDGTGRRRRLLSTGGAVGAFVLVGATIGLAVALTGTGGGGLPGLPAAPEHSQQTPAHHEPTTATSTGRPTTAAGPTQSPTPTLSPSPSSSASSAAPTQSAPGQVGKSNPHRHTPSPSKR